MDLHHENIFIPREARRCWELLQSARGPTLSVHGRGRHLVGGPPPIGIHGVTRGEVAD